MRRRLLLSCPCRCSPLTGAAPPAKPLTPSEIVKAAPASAWRAIDPEDLMVIDLKNGGRVIVQLAPAFAPVHVANIRALAQGRLVERRRDLPGAGQLCRAMGQ